MKFGFLPSIFRFNDYERDRFIEAIAGSVPAGAKVLDAGAGPCKYRYLFSHCDYKAQDFGAFEGEGHSYGELDYLCDIRAIPVEDGSFDCILCTEVLEHLPRPDQAIGEFSRIIKPGGRLVVTAPLGSGIHMAPFHYYGGFTPYWYQEFLSKYGFKIQSIESNGGFFKHYGQETRRFLTLITPEHRAARAAFLPVKAVLAVWFRVLGPLICHYLDRLDKDRAFTVGYFVVAVKR